MQGLLRTKFFIPQLPPSIVARPHLVRRLNQSLSGKLSLVVAPAGYGKTTLVTTWLHQLQTPSEAPQVIWLSLHAADNDVKRFFSYFVLGLAQLDEAFASLAEPFLQNELDSMSLEALIGPLLNQLVEYGHSVIFILDDYHEITQPDIHDALSFLLEHQPPSFHLLLTSRAEPPFSLLPRLRVRRQVTEIDTYDLRFSQNESAMFLNEYMDLNLSEANVAQLTQKTEGWVGSLQLAALSLQNQTDPAQFIQTFAGDDQYIVDYLIYEVLVNQTQDVQNFLLQTSILERFTASLCNAVTQQGNNQTILRHLQQARLFIIPLDKKRRWFRYHHLFADGLRTELLRSSPEMVDIYHERASRWFDEEGHYEEAIEHAFAAHHAELAGELMGRHARTILTTQGDNQRLIRWLAKLPEPIVTGSPQLLIAQAWLELYQSPHRDKMIEALVTTAASHVEQSKHRYDAGVIANMRTEIALIKGYRQQLNGNIPQAIKHNEEAVDLAKTAVHPFLKTGAPGALATTSYLAGNIDQFLAFSQPQRDRLRQAPKRNYAQWVFLSYIIDALHLNGQLLAADQLYRELDPKKATKMTAGLAMLAVSSGNLLRERNQLEEAEAQLTEALALLKQLPSMKIVVQTGAIALARTQYAQGKGETAVNRLLTTLQNFPPTNAYAPAARIAAAAALLQLRQGNREAAQRWAKEARLQATDEPTYLKELDYLVLARLLMNGKKPKRVLPLLNKLEQSAQQNGRLARQIEIALLKALTYQAVGDLAQAIEQMTQAIRLAEPMAFIRLFVDEGKATIPLLQQIAARGTSSAYVQQLLALLTERPHIATPKQAKAAAPLNNPLTERELTALRYLATDLAVPDIAEQMVVAPSTIRTYVKRIYGKLDAHSRIEAVNRARALGLLN